MNPVLCMDCKFWRRQSVEDFLNSTGESAGTEVYVGECHRHAPRVRESEANTTQWPLTTINDFCGDSERRDPEPDVELPPVHYISRFDLPDEKTR
jgi:hypothetical protein